MRRTMTIVIAVALLSSCTKEQGESRQNSCEDWWWQDCRTLVLQPGIFGHDRCKNPWHELVIEQGVPICRCKHRPECELRPK